MGWERPGPKRHFTYTRRYPGGYARHYIGDGPVANIASAALELGKLQRKANAQRRQAERQREAAIEAILGELADWTICLASIDQMLPPFGLRPTEASAGTMTSQNNPRTAGPLDVVELSRLATAANSGDRVALARLRHVLDSHDVVWRHIADLATRVETMLIEQASGGDQLLGESLRRKLAAMKSELAGDEPTPLEQLLVDRIAATWLHVQIAEVALAAASNQAQADRWRRILNGANQAYLAGIKLLSEVRVSAEQDWHSHVGPRHPSREE